VVEKWSLFYTTTEAASSCQLSGFRSLAEFKAAMRGALCTFCAVFISFSPNTFIKNFKIQRCWACLVLGFFRQKIWK